MEDWKRDYLCKVLAKNTKVYENYTINRIWNKIDNLDLKPIAQQYIKTDNSYILIDLFFPQINFAVECDEAHHKNTQQQDKEHDLNIYETLSAFRKNENVEIVHIDVTKNIENIHKQIDDVVDRIKRKIDEKTILHWQTPEERLKIVSSGDTLAVDTDITFRTIAEICSCFGKSVPPMRKCFFPLTKFSREEYVWCPKLAVTLKDTTLQSPAAGWLNILSDDWDTITETNTQILKGDSKPTYPEKLRITFAKSKDPLGDDVYRFVGVFKPEGERGTNGVAKYRRVADFIKLQ